MSGGHFDYNQYYIQEIINSLEDYIYGHEVEDVEDYIEYYCNWDNEEEKKYVRENRHSVPNIYGYNETTLSEFKKGLELLKKAYVYVQRIDWLLSDDDGEETFHERLNKELSNISN